MKECRTIWKKEGYCALLWFYWFRIYLFYFFQTKKKIKWIVPLEGQSVLLLLPPWRKTMQWNTGWDSRKAEQKEKHTKKSEKPSGPSQFINVHRSVGSSINHTPPSSSTSHPHSIKPATLLLCWPFSSSSFFFLSYVCVVSVVVFIHNIYSFCCALYNNNLLLTFCVVYLVWQFSCIRCAVPFSIQRRKQ